MDVRMDDSALDQLLYRCFLVQRINKVRHCALLRLMYLGERSIVLIAMLVYTGYFR